MEKWPDTYQVVMSGTKGPRGGEERPSDEATGAR
jgi:hypothetical protein